MPALIVQEPEKLATAAPKLNTPFPSFVIVLSSEPATESAIVSSPSITKVESETVQSVEGFAFSGCANINSVVLPNVLYIGDCAFSSLPEILPLPMVTASLHPLFFWMEAIFSS